MLGVHGSHSPKALARCAHLPSLRVERGRKGPQHPQSLLYDTPPLFTARQLWCATFREKPATWWLDESFAPLGNSSQRFARQYDIWSSIGLSTDFNQVA